MARPGRHCKNRLFEWTMTAALLGMGINLMIWPEAIAVSKFMFMLDVIGVTSLMLFYLLIGTLRGSALYLNGNWPIWGARVRALAAFGGAFVWLQMAVALIFMQNAITAAPSPSVWLYLSLVGAELYSCYRAAADARR